MVYPALDARYPAIPPVTEPSKWQLRKFGIGALFDLDEKLSQKPRSAPSQCMPSQATACPCGVCWPERGVMRFRFTSGTSAAHGQCGVSAMPSSRTIPIKRWSIGCISTGLGWGVSGMCPSTAPTGRLALASPYRIVALEGEP